MALEPRWNPKRGTWQVQYWQGKWRRKTVARAPKGWKVGDPEPAKTPPEAHAEYLRLCGVEKRAREGDITALPTSLRTFMEEHIETYTNPRTRETAEHVIRRFIDWCESRKVTRYEQVTRKVCKKWVSHAALTLSLATVATHRGYIAAAWGQQVKDEEIDKSPWKNVDPEGEDRTKPRKSWTKEQFAQLKSHCDEWLADILTVGVNTGLRIRPLTLIQWEDWERPQSPAERFGQLNIPTRLDKAGKGYKVPVSRELHDVLFRREATIKSEFCVTGQGGRPILDRSHVAKSIVRACVRAGLPRPQSPNHHMRRTFGRWAVKGYLTGTPVPLYIVSKWLGHIDPTTTLRYLDLDERESVSFMVPDFEGAPNPSEPSESATPRPATTPSPQTGDSGSAARSDDSGPAANGEAAPSH